MNVRPVYQRVGRAVRKRRKELGKSQQWLADRAGMSRASIANIETGRQQIMLHQLNDLQKALRLPRGALAP